MRIAWQVVAAAKLGLQSTGYELNPWLVFASRVNAAFSGVWKRTRFYQKDLWKVKFCAGSCNEGHSWCELQYFLVIDCLGGSGTVR